MLSFLFPGQGSQYSGMGKFLYDNFSIAKKCFEESSDALSQNMSRLCFEGPDSDLSLTENTQPALLTVSTALDRVLKSEHGLNPKFGAGHSLGEYSALVSAGSIDFSQTLNAVRIRGRAMQEAVPVGKGAMIAVMGLDEDQILKLCEWVESESTHSPLEPANYNSPGQVVISGSKTAADWLLENYSPEKLKHEKKAKFIPLKVSAPFHCKMMAPAQDKMQSVLSEMTFQNSSYPIIQNVTASAVSNSDELRINLIKQVSAPVKWAQSVKTLADSGVSICVEVGPGKVLSGLVKKIDSDRLKAFNVNNLEDLKNLEGAF